MRSPASSSRADSRTPWYRQPWLWLFAGPGIVVVASGVSAWLAVSSDDGLVATDYYKRGLLINRQLPVTAADLHPVAVTLTFDPNGRVRARIDGDIALPPRIELTLKGTAPEGAAQHVLLDRGDANIYGGMLEPSRHGHFNVTLESKDWRMPTTVASGPLTEVRLATTIAR